ncbi:hypothetical protein O3M35_012441 [Rhynocoris fuscipes]|uniref:Uncharacterized protein n=1 Tax=Rhynocoris fuscipes TaxID=488301 RepID=A0AAW1CUV7_9HEMI
MKVCMHFTNKRTVQFSACGFFNINYTTASSMVATACTYLVILIQMGGTKEYPSSIQE